MFVTCLYDIYGKPDSCATYVTLFKDLAESGLPFVVFTSNNLLEFFKDMPSSVTVISAPLESFELYSLCSRYTRELPSGRNPTKDTREFFGLMNTKAEFILKASYLFPDVNTFMWIDFGILKIVKNRPAFIDKLGAILGNRYEKLRIPGCWQFGRHFTVESVNWRFCGGFFIAPRHLIQIFYGHCKNVVTDFCTMPQYKLTWETNVWNIVEACAMRDDIEWYQADHNDTLLTKV